MKFKRGDRVATPMGIEGTILFVLAPRDGEDDPEYSVLVDGETYTRVFVKRVLRKVLT